MVKMGARGFYKIVIQPILKDWRLFFNLFLYFDFFRFEAQSILKVMYGHYFQRLLLLYSRMSCLIMKKKKANTET